MSAELRHVPRGALARCFLRSLFIQAAWNRRGMQNLGFAYAIAPALEALYPDAEAHRAALARHLGFFNCHPYAAAGILGGAIHHEERVAAGLEGPGAPATYKATLQGPLAALGDGFFWTGLRPFCGALAALGALAGGWPAVLAAIALYNAVHLTLRVGLFRTGYREGDAIVGVIGRLSWPSLAARLRLAAVVLCGLSAAVLGAAAGRAGGPAGLLLSIGISAAGYLALVARAPLLPATYAAAALGLAAAVAGHLHGSPW